MKYISLDIETLGLDKDHDDIIEVGAVIDELIEGVEPTPIDKLPRFKIFIGNKNKSINGNVEAIQMHMRSGLWDAWLKADKFDEETAMLEFHSWLFRYYPHSSGEKRNAAGKNLAGFDIPFLCRLPVFKNMIYPTISHKVIDPAELYTNFLTDRCKPSLPECKQRAGFTDKNVTHWALDDCIDVVRLIRHKVYER